MARRTARDSCSMLNGLVSSDTPGSTMPLCTTAFFVNPVMKRTFRPGVHLDRGVGELAPIGIGHHDIGEQQIEGAAVGELGEGVARIRASKTS